MVSEYIWRTFDPENNNDVIQMGENALLFELATNASGESWAFV